MGCIRETGPSHAYAGSSHSRPAASKPHDLDNPFHDSKAQERIGIAIAKSVQ